MAGIYQMGSGPQSLRLFLPRRCAHRFRPAERRSIRGLVPRKKEATSGERIARTEKIERDMRVVALDGCAELRRNCAKPSSRGIAAREAHLLEPCAQRGERGAGL